MTKHFNSFFDIFEIIVAKDDNILDVLFALFLITYRLSRYETHKKVFSFLRRKTF